MKKQKKNKQTVINQTITPEEKKGFLSYVKKILTTGRLGLILSLLSIIVPIVIYYVSKTPEIETARVETKAIADDILKTIPQDLTGEVKNEECTVLKVILGSIKVGTQHYLKMQENALYDKMNPEDDLSQALIQDMENRQSIMSMTGFAINAVTNVQEKYITNYYGYGQINLNMANTVENAFVKSDYENQTAEINNLLKVGKSKEAFEKLRKFHNSIDTQEMYRSLFSYIKMLTDILTPRYQELLKQEQESVQ